MLYAKTSTDGGCQVCYLGPVFSLLQLCICGGFIPHHRCCPLRCCESRVFETKGQLTSVSLWRRGLRGSGPCLPLPSLGHPEPCSHVPCSVLLAGCQVWLFCSVASAVLSRYGGRPSLTDLLIHCLCLRCKSGLCAP